MKHLHLLSLIVAGACALGACADTAECDPDYELVGPTCFPRDAGEPVDATIGDACMTDDECGSEYPYCAVQPGATVGVCTITGCDTDPTLCPTGYRCLDLTAFGAPAVCVAE